MLLGDADIEVTIRQSIFENIKFSSAWHGCGDGNDLRIVDRQIGYRLPENFRTSRCCNGIGGAVFDFVSAESVKFSWVIERRLVTAAFFSDDVEDNRIV